MKFDTKEFIEKANLLAEEIESYKSMLRDIVETDDADMIDGMLYEIQDTYQTILSIRGSLLKMLDEV